MVNASPLNLITCTRPRTQVTLGMARGRKNPGAIFAYKNCLDLQVKPVNFCSENLQQWCHLQLPQAAGVPHIATIWVDNVNQRSEERSEASVAWSSHFFSSSWCSKQVFVCGFFSEEFSAMPLIRNSLMILMVTVVMFHPLNSGLWGSY